MTGVADAEEGHLIDGTLIIRRDDGALRLLRYVRRAVRKPNSTSVFLRGLDHDITSTATATATATGDFALSILDADIATVIAHTTGTYCALIDTRTGCIITWISEPIDGLDHHEIGGRAPLLDADHLAAIAVHHPTVLHLKNSTTTLARSYPCIGHGATAAVLLLLTPL